MLRISWPLAFVVAGAIAVVARRPKLLAPVILAFGIWFVIEVARGRRR